MENNQVTKSSNNVGAWIWAILGALYCVSPVDIIPDIPVIGWIDDFFVAASTSLNLIEKSTKESMMWLSTIAKSLKWVVIILGAIIVLLVALLGAVIVSFLQK